MMGAALLPNAAPIHRELEDQHIAVSVLTVSRWLAILRTKTASASKWATIAHEAPDGATALQRPHASQECVVVVFDLNNERSG
jgi:hypothetical protein